MMQTLDLLRSQLGDCVVVLGCEDNGKLNLVVGVSKTLTESITAPSVMQIIGPIVGAKGGGRPDMARAGGGTQPEKLQDAFQAAQNFVQDEIG